MDGKVLTVFNRGAWTCEVNYTENKNIVGADFIHVNCTGKWYSGAVTIDIKNNCVWRSCGVVPPYIVREVDRRKTKFIQAVIAARGF